MWEGYLDVVISAALLHLSSKCVPDIIVLGKTAKMQKYSKLMCGLQSTSALTGVKFAMALFKGKQHNVKHVFEDVQSEEEQLCLKLVRYMH